MKRSEHFNVAAGKWLNVYPLSVNGHKYVISGVDSDNSLVLHCLDAKDIVCEYSDLMIGSSHIFVNHCDHVICEARRLFVDEQSHHELYVVNKGDEWRSYWVEDSYVIGANCCTIRSISDFLREKNKFSVVTLWLSTIAVFPLTTLWMLLQMFRVFSRLCSATWTVMVKLLIAIPTRECIVFLRMLRLSIGLLVDSSTTRRTIRCVPSLMS